MGEEFDPVISGKSIERLEDEIAAIYQEAHRVNPGVRVQEVGVLKALWSEFDRRAAEGLISEDA